MKITVHLAEILKKRNVTSKELAKKNDITEANISILRSGNGKGIRFNTLLKICDELDCQPGDIIKFDK